ncbi:Ff.00g034190.m01.CDS01 [Fusarium sp. VM40]|nr:Ff.00g034190.m01.CDS01 [Fusarium sp. VM40]
MFLLEAGKNVLLEKAFTVNGSQAKPLATKAKEKNVLLMEALWTRYFPVLAYAGGFDDDNHIMVNPRLAGGIILDAGIYSLAWVFQTLYSTQPTADRKPPTVKSIVAKYPRTGVDSMVTVLLEFPREVDQGGPAHAVATCSLGLSNDTVAETADASAPSVRIQGQQGENQVFPTTYRPTHTRLILKDGTVEDKKGRSQDLVLGVAGIVDLVLM